MPPPLADPASDPETAGRSVKQTVRRAGRFLAHTPLGRLVPDSTKERLRRHVIAMTEADVAGVVDAVEQTGVPYAIAGGWGIDALAGGQTRPHTDVDLVVPDDPGMLEQVGTALRTLGFRVVDEEAVGGAWMPRAVILRDDRGRTVEMLPVPEMPETVAGHLGGATLRCAAPEAQLRFHSGYAPRPQDRHDVAFLCERFGLAEPPDYAPTPRRERVRKRARALVQWLRDTRETALVVPVPEADAAIGHWRRMFDSSAAAGIPAHVTVLYPFVPGRAIDDGVRERLRALAATHRGFDFQLTAIDRFPGILYLAPSAPEPFVRLTEAVAAAWPDHPPYGGAFAEVIPHVTVVDRPTRELRHIEAALERSLPVAGRADELVLLVRRRNGQWKIEGRFPLGS